MEWLTLVYFMYMFVAIYFLLLIILLYLRNRSDLFFIPELTENYPLSILIPAWNEQDTIQETIEHIFKTDYKGLKEVIVINDGSTDKTKKIVERLLKKYGKLKLINKENSGKADSLNFALKKIKGEFFAVIDADSYPSKTAFSRLMGYFDDNKVGIVTAACTPLNRKSLLTRLQTIEYKVIAFTRKLLEYIDSIYVAPGSLSVYRKNAFDETGGFDTKNLTEDIEATWHALKNNWKVKMCLASKVYTNVPDKVKPWFRQRVRWSVGGLQVISKYRKSAFRENMLGYFIIPFFSLGLFLGLIGLGFLIFLGGRRLLKAWLISNYSIVAGTQILNFGTMGTTPTVLNYFGLVVFALFLLFTFFVLAVMKDKITPKQSFFNLVFYMVVYLLIYPIVMVVSIKEWIQGKRKWR